MEMNSPAATSCTFFESRYMLSSCSEQNSHASLFSSANRRASSGLVAAISWYTSELQFAQTRKSLFAGDVERFSICQTEKRNKRVSRHWSVGCIIAVATKRLFAAVRALFRITSEYVVLTHCTTAVMAQ